MQNLIPLIFYSPFGCFRGKTRSRWLSLVVLLVWRLWLWQQPMLGGAQPLVGSVSFYSFPFRVTQERALGAPCWESDLCLTTGSAPLHQGLCSCSPHLAAFRFQVTDALAPLGCHVPGLVWTTSTGPHMGPMCWNLSSQQLLRAKKSLSSQLLFSVCLKGPESLHPCRHGLPELLP